MKGIEFVVDDQGQPKAVLIDLTEHGALWEDICDSLLAEPRRGEPRESLDEVKALLRAEDA